MLYKAFIIDKGEVSTVTDSLFTSFTVRGPDLELAGWVDCLGNRARAE